MGKKFAEGTKVSASKSKDELERLMERFGATKFLSGRSVDPPMHFIVFEISGRPYRLEIKVPSLKEFKRGPRGFRSDETAEKFRKQEVNRRWREVAHITKAILVGVEGDYWNFEEAMQPFHILPDNRTVREALKGNLDSYARSGSLPLLLPGPQ